MKAYFSNLPTRTWLLIVVPAAALCYPIVCTLIPAIVHAVVPDVVKNLLSLL